MKISLTQQLHILQKLVIATLYHAHRIHGEPEWGDVDKMIVMLYPSALDKQVGGYNKQLFATYRK